MPRNLWRRILVPHDFSSSANHAAAIARDQAQLNDGKIVLLHVCDLPSDLGPDTTMVMPNKSEPPISMRQFAIASAETHLTDISQRLEKDGVPVEMFVLDGRPVDVINRFVAEHQIDVVVMGTHGRTGVRHLIAGSVTERVVRTCAVPVLTIRHPDD